MTIPEVIEYMKEDMEMIKKNTDNETDKKKVSIETYEMAIKFYIKMLERIK